MNRSIIPRREPLIIAACVLSLAILLSWYCLAAGSVAVLPSLLGFSLLGMAFALEDADAAVKKTKALPASGGSSINSDGIDLGVSGKGDFLANCELKLSAPALNTTELPNGQTMTYIIQHDTASDFSTATTLFDNVIVQTGAGGAGAAAATAQLRLPADVKQHVRARATSSATAGDASGKSLTLQLVF